MFKTIIENVQGIRGSVTDKFNKPIRSAIVTINMFADIYKVTPNSAVFKAYLPIGFFTVNVSLVILVYEKRY